jgi:hypothetical protein
MLEIRIYICRVEIYEPQSAARRKLSSRKGQRSIYVLQGNVHSYRALCSILSATCEAEYCASKVPTRGQTRGWDKPAPRYPGDTNFFEKPTKSIRTRLFIGPGAGIGHGEPGPYSRHQTKVAGLIIGSRYLPVSCNLYYYGC